MRWREIGGQEDVRGACEHRQALFLVPRGACGPGGATGAEGGACYVQQVRAWGGGNNRVAVTVAAAESSLYQYVLYFSYSEYNQTVLDPVFDADHDARISLGQGRRQLAAFQRQSRVKGGISPLAGRLCVCELALFIA